ncbi:MAG: bifunctional (p)ppGpp synthetase/guanosine-3,5-bis(diphosphate) 3-pyrophosphohydrolase [Bacillales bacterium]|jgi:GTP pyrophosphokinase|nr:bifunctional (p)ppGpp synthetase/guanosine-3,5-bis(diphosphate) 3-pyrophosphohydrolase [Bacillales bacterium]
MEKGKIYTFEDVLANARKYLTDPKDIALIEKAYHFAYDLHVGQQRQSGEAYIVHPIQVAGILVELEMDPATIAAGFLHDVVEDTDTTLEQIKNEFNENVMHLVDGVTKLGKIKFSSLEETQAENHRKMFVAMATDFRIILIKFADRLHNIRTLKFLSEEKQKRIANETLEIFAPLANRLGISNIQWELEDISLKYLNPTYYQKIVELINQKRTEREGFLAEVMNEIRKSLVDVNIEAEVYGRPKHIYSIYKKMYKKNKPFDEIYDLFAVRIIVKDIKDCYAVLGAVHSIWRPIPGRFKDFIAMPKSNMYQSIHTTVIGPKAVPFEIQIRTEEMHRIAQFGIAAHWAYKQGKDVTNLKNAEKKLDFYREFIEGTDQDSGAVEFMKSLKQDLLEDMVYVYTPRGDLFELPKGSVPIDFAYRVHSDVGNKCVGAKVNGRIVTLDTALQTGDIIEILTNKNSAGPSRDWLKIAYSVHTKNKIKQFFKKQNREENVKGGRDAIEKEIRDLEIGVKEAFAPENLKRVLEKYNFLNEDDLYAAVGYGGMNASQIAMRLTEKIRRNRDTDYLEQRLKESANEPKVLPNYRRDSSGVIVPGIDNLLIRLSRCCNPIPGDQILGFITKGRGVSVHRFDCRNVMANEEQARLINVEWDASLETKEYTVEIEIQGYDRSNLLRDVLAAVSETRTSIDSVFGHGDKDKGAVITMSLRVPNKQHLEKVYNRIRQVPEVYDIKRLMS